MLLQNLEFNIKEQRFIMSGRVSAGSMLLLLLKGQVGGFKEQGILHCIRVHAASMLRLLLLQLKIDMKEQRPRRVAAPPLP